MNVSLGLCLLEVAVHVLFRMLEDVAEGRNQLLAFATIDVSVVYCKVAIHHFAHHDFISLHHWGFGHAVDRHEHSAVGKT